MFLEYLCTSDDIEDIDDIADIEILGRYRYFYWHYFVYTF